MVKDLRASTHDYKLGAFSGNFAGMLFLWLLQSSENENKYFNRDATGTVQKSRKLSLDRGSGGRAPSGVQRQRPGGGSS